MYKTNNNIIAIRATIAVNNPVVAIFAIAVVKDTLSVSSSQSVLNFQMK